jgi:hypothetical protein
VRAIERHNGAIQVEVLRDLDLRWAIAQIVAADSDRLRPGVYDVHGEAAGEPALEAGLQRVVLVVTDRREEFRGGGSSEALEVRLTCAGAVQDLPGIQIEALRDL